MPTNVRQNFQLWCSKQNVIPKFNMRIVGRKQNTRFLCEVRIPNFSYIGFGSSNTKLKAQANAAEDFLQFVTQQSICSVLGQPNNDSKHEKPVYNEVHRTEGKMRVVSQTALNQDRAEENADCKLNVFLRDKKLTPTYNFFVQREIKNNTWSFVCECELFVEELNRSVSSRALGCSKESARKKCVLLIVRQLVNLEILVLDPTTNEEKETKNCEVDALVVEAPKVTNEKKENTTGKPSYKVVIDPALIREARIILQNFGIPPLQMKNDPPTAKAISLLDNVESISAETEVVNWNPPAPSKNVWKSGISYEKSVGKAFLNSLSRDLENDLKYRMMCDTSLQESLRARCTLPIHEKKTEIIKTIANVPIVVIFGELATQKMTQVCQYILDDFILTGRGAYCNILVTQTHRLSAISAADRISVERREKLGTSVGYSVPFDNVFPRLYGSILFCTVDILLRKMEHGLKDVSHIIVDGLHDRDLNTDFLLVILRDMVHKYPGLRIILMSDITHLKVFRKYFHNCPCIVLKMNSLQCRTYCFDQIYDLVKILSRKLTLMNRFIRASSPPLTEAILNFINTMKIPGTILIFDGSFDDIHFRAKYLKKHPIFGKPNFLILLLHSDSSKDELRKVTDKAPPNVRKIIVATNIAETSILIDDVVFVIDTCKTETKVFTPHSGMTKYVVSSVSRANRQHRENHARCKVLGHYFCLFSEKEIAEIPDEYATPEIRRSSLCKIALVLKLLRLNSIEQSLNKMIEPPSEAVISVAKLMLQDLNCLSSNDGLTPLGQTLARLPFEPNLGKMAILGMIFGIGDLMATILITHLIRPLTYDIEENFVPKTFTGRYRFSKHIGILSVFQQWSQAANCGPKEEEEFCRLKNVPAYIARMVKGTKDKLKDILLDLGFAEESLLERTYDFQSEDPNINMAVALLTMGLYPNVYIFDGKINTVDHSKVQASKWPLGFLEYCGESEFYSPFSVFGEMMESIRGKVCREITMVTPIHLLLFGCRKIELVGKVIRMDNWIDLEMDPDTASVIVALRYALDRLVMKTAKHPESIVRTRSSIDHRVLEITRKLCALDAGCYGMQKDVYSVLQETKKNCNKKRKMENSTSDTNSVSSAIVEKTKKYFDESDKFEEVFKTNKYSYIRTDEGLWGRKRHQTNVIRSVTTKTAEFARKNMPRKSFRTSPAALVWQN